MPEPVPKRKWRLWRSCFRGVRIGILLLLFFAVAALCWLDFIGLPDFLKRPMVNALHERGVDLQFSRLRFHWSEGFVADNVRFGAARFESNAPQLSIREVQLHIDHPALVHFKFKIDSLLLRGGQLIWHLDETNEPPETLSVTNIQTQLNLLPNDQWQLSHFNAAFAGAKLRLSGSITNASALRDWKIFQGHGETQPTALRHRLRELARTIDGIKFAKPPALDVEMDGDARATQTFHGRITLEASGAQTPWGTLTNGVIIAKLIAPETTNSPSKAEFTLLADEAATRWGGVGRLQINLHAAGDDNLTNLVHARMELSAVRFVSPWVQAPNIRFAAHWTHSLTNPIPDAGTGELRLVDAQTRWGGAGEIRLAATLATPVTNTAPRADASWAWWAALQPYVLNWNCNIANIHAAEFKSPKLVCSGTWTAPNLTLTNLHTEMYGGKLDASASLDIVSRVARFACISDFDILQATPFLTPGGSNWVTQQEFEWTQPPLARVSGSATLPAWTNAHPNWPEIRPSLVLQGDFKIGQGGFHRVLFNSARSHFIYTNMVWDLPDLDVMRSEGAAQIELTSDDKSLDYYFRFHSTIDPKAMRHLLDSAGQRAVDEVQFSQPPLIDGELWGHWHDHTRIGGRADVTVTNFSYRNESATLFRGALAYTNEFLLLTNARVERTNEYGTAEAVGFDFKAKKGYLTNAFSTISPLAVVHCIGPKITKDMEPYKFLNPPTAQAYGVIPLSDDTTVADLHFKLDGGPFEWLKFKIPRISGVVDWVGEGMTLSNVKADFYGGKLGGSAAFDFHPKERTDFKFDTLYTDVSLGALMGDIGETTNHLEGTLNGRLIITNANTLDHNSWFGSGRAQLHDGLIWEIPIFGVLTPLLDSIVEGWGKTRISDATATFIITNSVIRSDNLELRSPTVRLYYRGTVDFDMKVDAKVEAEVGRDTPLVGPIVKLVQSPFSKMFETRVTGTLRDPKRSPATWVGTFFSPFFHPWKTFKDLLPGESVPPVYPQTPPPAQPDKSTPQ